MTKLNQEARDQQVLAILTLGAAEFHAEHDAPITVLSSREVMLQPGVFMLVNHEHEYTAVVTTSYIDHNRPTDLERALDDPTVPLADGE